MIYLIKYFLNPEIVPVNPEIRKKALQSEDSGYNPEIWQA
jgi:hypothetical protein